MVQAIHEGPFFKGVCLFNINIGKLKKIREIKREIESLNNKMINLIAEQLCQIISFLRIQPLLVISIAKREGLWQRDYSFVLSSFL
jgi:hypothetical protein